MKKIIIIIMIFMWFQTFWYNSIEDKINYFFSKKEKQIYNINKNNYCNNIISFYKKIFLVLPKYKIKYPKYKKVLDLIYSISIKREENIAKTCKNKNKKTINSKINRKWDFILNSKINKKIFFKAIHSNINIKILPQINISTNFDLNSNVIKVDKYIKNNLKIWNSWYSMLSYIYFDVPENYINKIISNKESYFKKTNTNKLFYIKNNNKYKVFLAKKENIKKLYFFDPTKSIYYNAQLIRKIWWIFIKKFLYVRLNNWFLPYAWIVAINNWLYYIIPSWQKISYIKINTTQELIQSIIYKKFPLIILYDNKYYSFDKWAIKFYYLWPYELYKNINIKNMWYILYQTFYRIVTTKYNYNVINMYYLALISLNFNWKKLSDVFKRINNNFTYDKTISKLINLKKIPQNKLVKYLSSNNKLLKSWIDFYTLKTKKWTCQTISDIFSLIALFNWLNATIQDWYVISQNYAHQISKIEWYYYDPTYKLNNNSSKYFWMSKKDVSLYFRFK